LNDGRIQNPYSPFGIVPLSNFVPRGFGFVHHSIAILDHEVPNPNLTIRDFLIAVGGEEAAAVIAGYVGVLRISPERLRFMWSTLVLMVGDERAKRAVAQSPAVLSGRHKWCEHTRRPCYSHGRVAARKSNLPRHICLTLTPSSMYARRR
jgi:hypothetical protein